MPSSSIKFRADIQGLRAIAVLAVLLFHFDKNMLAAGFIGVDIFFVISGFLITSILVNKKNQQSFSVKSLFVILKSFYSSRIKRIVPAYFVLLIITAIVAAILFIPQDFKFFNSSLKRAIFFYSNQYFASFGDYFAPSSYELPLLHTWSLAIEMQFYFLYPLIVLLLPTKILKVLILPVALVLIFISEYFLQIGKEQSVYYSLFARAPEFLFGGFAFLFLKSFKDKSFFISLLGVFSLIFGFWVINSESKFPGVLSIFPALGASLIILGNAKKSFIFKFLSLPILVWIGAISYSLYLWHWAILTFMRYVNGTYALTLVQLIIAGGGAFILASFSYYFVEQKFRTKNFFKLKFSWLFLIIPTFSLVFLFPKINNLSNSSIPIELTRSGDDAKRCHSHIVGDCIRGDKSSLEESILVLGDSHAGMLNIFFDNLGKKENLKFKVITGSSCITIKDFDYKRIADWAHSDCKSQIEYAQKQLEKSNKIILAGLWEYHIDSANFKKALISFFEENYDKKIFILADIPSFLNYQPLRAFHLEELNLNFTKADFNSKVKEANEKIEFLSKNYKNVSFIDLVENNPLFKEVPFYNKILFYSDKHHLNELGSKYYAKTSLVKLRKYLKE